MFAAAEVVSQDSFAATNFTEYDWAIVILYPLISLGIGLYVRRFIKNMKDFVLIKLGESKI